jgi:Na+-driven multidrug efflux pump
MDSHDLEAMRFRAEIEHEDEQRRMATRLGYRTGDWRSAVFTTILIALGIQVVMVIAVAFAGGFPRGFTDNPWSLLFFLPEASILVIPFLFLKPRYARWGLAIIAILAGVTWLVMMGEDWIVKMLT